MNHELNVREPSDPMVRIKTRALRVIAMYGALRWCNNSVCGCMGCANSSMTKEEHALAMTMPEVQEALSKVPRVAPFPNVYFSGGNHG